MLNKYSTIYLSLFDIPVSCTGDVFYINTNNDLCNISIRYLYGNNDEYVPKGDERDDIE